MNQVAAEINLDHFDVNILVVDDEEANIRLLQRMFQKAGYTHVFCTQEPTQVASLYQQHQFDLILLDLDMPVLDGFGVIERLKIATNNNLPAILVLTAQSMQSYRQRALDEGARDYVTKPFDMSELLSRVRNLVEVQIAHKFINDQNQILEAKVQVRTQELTETRLQVVRHLGRAAEYRDNETGLHIIRMSKMAVEIAKGLGMDQQECDLLLNAAPMHDIGKIGIPDRILLKTGKLNAEEWEIMKTHASIGEEVLADDDSELMVMAREIAGSHHEKWNGQGYPRGLKGDEIPLSGRITAIADVFDALTSIRSYKVAWPISEARDFIIGESGQHFEPRLVDIFLTKLPEIIKIKEQYAEPTKK